MALRLILSPGTAQVATKYALNGPFNNKYNVTINVEDDQSILWSPCGDASVPLNINHRITLSSSSASAYGYIKSDGTFAANFVWRKCIS
jgi:hypothetical protein